MVILAKKPGDYKSAESFLKKRDIEAYSASSVKDGMALISKYNANWVLVSANLPGANIDKIPGFLTQTFNCRCIAFGEDSSPQTQLKLSKVKLPVIQGKPSGPAIQTKIKNILAGERSAKAEQQRKQSTWKEDSDSNIRVTSKGGAGRDAVTVKSSDKGGDDELRFGSNQDQSDVSTVKGSRSKDQSEFTRGARNRAASYSDDSELGSQDGMGEESRRKVGHEDDGSGSISSDEWGTGTATSSGGSDFEGIGESSLKRSDGDYSSKKNRRGDSKEGGFGDDSRSGSEQNSDESNAREQRNTEDLWDSPLSGGKARSDDEDEDELSGRRRKNQDGENASWGGRGRYRQEEDEANDSSKANRKKSDLYLQKGQRGERFSETEEGAGAGESMESAEGAGAGKSLSATQEGADAVDQKRKGSPSLDEGQRDRNRNPSSDDEGTGPRMADFSGSEEASSASAEGEQQSEEDSQGDGPRVHGASESGEVSDETSEASMSSEGSEASSSPESDTGREDGEEADLDPDEPGIEPKEKRRRQTRRSNKNLSNGRRALHASESDVPEDKISFYDCIYKTCMELQEAEADQNSSEDRRPSSVALVFNQSFLRGFVVIQGPMFGSSGPDWMWEFTNLLRLHLNNANLSSEFQSLGPLEFLSDDPVGWAESVGVYAAVAHFQKNTLVAAVVESDNVPPTLNESNRHDKHLEIPASLLGDEVRVTFDVFIEVGERCRLLKYVRKGRYLTSEQKARWLERPEVSFLLDRKDKTAFEVLYVSDLLRKTG